METVEVCGYLIVRLLHLLGKILNRDLEFCDVGSSCDEKRLGIRSGVVMGLMTGGRRHGVNMAIG